MKLGTPQSENRCLSILKARQVKSITKAPNSTTKGSCNNTDI
jgi:hypothetical protein